MAAHSYLIDMHIHLRDRSPCSHLGFDQLYEQVVDRLYGVCLTDHFVLEPLSLKYGGILKVFFGVELTCESGDVLAYGLSDVPSRGLSLHDLIEAIHHQGGIAVAAHPFDPMRLAIKEDVYNYPFDAIEINGSVGKKKNHEAKMAAEILDLPMIGGSDAHDQSHLNTIVTEFYDPINSISDIIAAIKKRNCKPRSIH